MIRSRWFDDNARPDATPASQLRAGFPPSPAPKSPAGRVLDDGWRSRQDALAVADDEHQAWEEGQRPMPGRVRKIILAQAEMALAELPVIQSIHGSLDRERHLLAEPRHRGSRFIRPKKRLGQVQNETFGGRP